MASFDEKIDIISKEVGIRKGDLLVNFRNIMEKVNIRPATMAKTLQEKEEIALNELRARCSKAQIMGGKAEEFVGMVLGQGGTVDVVAGLRRKALDMIANDKSQAIIEGYSTPDGQPKFKEDFGISKAGEIIPEHKYLAHSFGVASKGDETPKPFNLTLSDELAVSGFPRLIPIRFKVVDRSKTPDHYDLGMSAQTTWIKEDNAKLPTPIEIVESSLLSSYRIPLSKLEEWFGENSEINSKDAMYKVFISLVTVTNIAGTSVKKTGNRIVYVDDYDAEPIPTFCWVPDELINFGIGSKIYIIGTVKYADAFSPGGGRSGEQQLTVNVMGVIPKEIVKPEEVTPLTQETVTSSPWV